MWVSNQCHILKIIGRTKVKQMLCFDNSRIQGEDPSLWIQPLYIPRWWFCGCWFIVYHCSRCLWVFVFGPCFCNAVLNVLSSFFHYGRESWLLYFVFLLSCSGTCKYVVCLPTQCRGLVYGLWLWYFLSFLALSSLSCFFVLSVMAIPMYFIDWTFSKVWLYK